MSVLIETTNGSIVVDVFDEQKLGYNFLKLCKMNYFFFSKFFGLKADKIVMCGEPNYPRIDNRSICHFVPGHAIRSLDLNNVDGMVDVSDVSSDLPLTVGMVSFVKHDACIGSQFSITLGEDGEEGASKLPFGKVVEGFDTLVKICDSNHDSRILHTHILHDPFPDPEGFSDLIPRSLFPNEYQLSTIDIPELTQSSTIEALTLELMGDLSHFDVKPSPSILFITRLNPITTAESLEIIFSRFGTVVKCTVVKDKDGKSKRYGFIEFETKDEAEMAYDKLVSGCIIDGNEVIVDFSQSTRAKK